MKQKNVLFIITIIILSLSIIFITSIGTNKNNISNIIQNKKIILIDVRTEEEYKAGHIPRAINIPSEKIEKEINYAKTQPIAIYCRTGRRSKESASILKSKGYTKIYDLGSINNYKGKLIN